MFIGDHSLAQFSYLRWLQATTAVQLLRMCTYMLWHVTVRVEKAQASQGQAGRDKQGHFRGGETLLRTLKCTSVLLSTFCGLFGCVQRRSFSSIAARALG